MQSRSQNTQQPILLSTQKRDTALRKLISESWSADSCMAASKFGILNDYLLCNG